jgi:hypothetical protein
MAERVNKIYIKDGQPFYYCERWGGGQVWLDGLTTPSVVLKRCKEFSDTYESWQYGIDGAVLIN